MSVAQILRQGALRHPERVAVVALDGQSGRRELTYEALDSQARAVAAGLAARGVEPGGRVALRMANGPDTVAAWFGAVYAGATVVPVSILAAPPEVAVRVEHAGAAFLLETLEGLPDVAPLRWPRTPPPDAPAMILYTSGTTGSPKGAAISHASLLVHTAGLVHHTLELAARDVVLGVLPLSHSYGCRMVMLATFYAGARAVLLPRFSARGSLEAMAAEGVTWAPAVPTMFAAWAQVAGREAPADLRWALSAGAPLADDVRERAEVVLGAEIRQGYGMTEATFSTIDGPRAPRRVGTVGRPVWGVEVRVVDEDDRDVAPGERGQVLVRGPNMMAGYLDDPETTAEVTRGGWMHTGDIGVLDEDGWLTVVDRTRDIILRGGFTVYPSEVEDVLARHPGVAQVAVVGRPDPFYGEEVVAFVVPAAGGVEPEALLAWAAERLGSDKLPREVVTAGALPVGGSGKVLKRELVARLAEAKTSGKNAPVGDTTAESR